jgi:lipoprotein-anchoring transpeptidase ErfK/SrfK
MLRLNNLIALLMLSVLEAAAQSKGRRIVVSVSDRKLAVLEDGQVSRVFDVAVGKATTPSPTGTFQIVVRIPHPTWYGPRKVVGPGKQNPLGTRWIGLSHKGYGIHGTNNPRSIGKAASHGCIRMRNEDAEELFGMVEIGDTVELIDFAPQELAEFLQTQPDVPAPVLIADGGAD